MCRFYSTANTILLFKFAFLPCVNRHSIILYKYYAYYNFNTFAKWRFQIFVRLLLSIPQSHNDNIFLDIHKDIIYKYIYITLVYLLHDCIIAYNNVNINYIYIHTLCILCMYYTTFSSIRYTLQDTLFVKKRSAMSSTLWTTAFQERFKIMFCVLRDFTTRRFNKKNCDRA